MRHHNTRSISLWGAALIVAVVLLVPARASLDKVHMVLLLLLVVLGGSATGGRALGVALAIAGFVSLNWFLLPPYYTFRLADGRDWVVLLAYLAVSLVAAQLMHRSRQSARIAEQHRRAAERSEALSDADKLKDALLAAVSHDLRTPLTTIKALAHDLTQFGDERAEIIEQEADRLNRTVADLLDLSRLNGGALAINSELNAVDDLLGALAQRVEPVLAGRPLEFGITPSHAVLFGRFDLVHSLRILSNLVENAARFSPPSAAIEVLTDRKGSEIVLTVADRGRGVRPQDAGRIFDAYFSSEETGRSGPGAGLGLHIARRLAEAQGGSLEYAPRPGGGSVFKLLLPAVDVDDMIQEAASL